METKIFKSINLIRRVSGANLNLFRYTAMVAMLLMLGVGNAWASGSTYYSQVTTSQSPTGKGTVYVVAGGTFSGTATSATNSGSSQSQTYSLKATPMAAGYYFVNWTSTGTATLSFKSSTNASTTCSITATSESSSSPTTGKAQANWAEITIGAGTASPIAAEDNSATATTNTCTVTYATKGDNMNDFASATVGGATGHGSFTAALGSVTSAGAATVNVTFKGDGTYGGNVAVGSRSRTSSAVVTLTSAVGNNKGTCTVTASFPNIAIGEGSFDHMTTINTVPKSATATFPVQWADDELDFSASFGSVTGGGEWTVNEPLRYNATDGTISIDYTFNPNGAEGDHSAVLTLAANANAGGASKTLTLTAEAEALAAYDASIGDTKYPTLAAAITAANEMNMNTNPTVKILRNVEGLTSALEIKKPMTIDLNSFTVSGTLTSSVNKLFYLNTDAAVLTINDSRNGGKISATGNAAAALTAVLVDKGSLVLTKGDIEIENTNTGASANAIAVCIMAGARFGMTGGNLNAVAAGTGAYGVMTTTNPTDVDMIGITGGTITAAAATTGVGIYCKSSSTTLPSDPTNANVALSGVTIDASATGATAHAVQTDAGVILGINSGTYNATVATTTARAVLSKGYTAVMNGTFNATAGTTDANAIRVEAGIVAVRAGLFNATTVQRIAHAGYVANGAKLLTYGGTFHGKSTTMIANGYATGTQVVSGGTLEAQGGTFIGEAANTGLGAAQTSYAIGVFANTGSNVTLANATLRGLTDNTYVNGAYAFYTSTVNPVSLTNCTLEATSTDQYAYGVRLEGGATPLTMNNCTVNATAATLYAYGFYQNNATSTIDVTGSTFNVTSNGTRAYGIYVNAGTSFSATDCDFTVRTLQNTAGAAAGSYLRGIFVAAGKTANLTGCTFNVSGHATYSTDAYGLYISGSVNVENTDVTVSSVKSGYAIFNDGSTTAINIFSGKFSATTAESNATAAAAKQQLYGGYYVHNNNLAKYLPEGYMVETLTAGTEFNAGYKYHVRPETVVNDPVCKIGSTGYATLEEALEFVNKNSGTAYTIYMVKDYTLPAGNYTLPAKATLLVPYKTGTGTGATTAIGSGGSSYVTTNTTPSRFRKLTFANGVNMSVLGTIEVSGQKYLTSSNATGIPTGPYGQLVLEENAHIDLESQSNLIAWGYVTGNGSINAKKNATIYETFQLLDMKGGGVTSQLVNDSRNPQIFPITHYAYQNVEAEITYRPGSRAVGWTGASIQSSNQTANDVMMVGNMSSGALFLMADEGEASDTWVKKKYDPVTDRVEYTLNNTATLGSINVDLSSINLASSSYILPIASNMTVTMKYGTMTITQNSYFMPGSVLNIEKEATLTIPSGKALYFVDKAQWVKGYAPAQYVCVVPYSPSFNNGAGGAGKTYSARKSLMSDNTNLLPAELFVHGNIEVNGALYTTESGANIHSTNSDAGTILFNSIAANKNFCQLNSTCGEGAGGPGGSPGGDKCGTFGKLGCTTGVCDCYYWNWNTWPCTSAQLKNETGFTSSVSGGAGTYVYKNGAWTKVAKEGCFTTETDGSGKHYYANPSDIVEVVRNSDDSYRDVESGFRRFVWDANCEWWEVETTPTSEGYYKAIKADHNDRYNYYEYNSSADYWQIKNITVTWNVNGVTTNYSIGYGTHPKYLSVSPSKASTTTDYYTWLGWTKGSETGEFFAKDAELPVATENTTYYAYFKADKFTFRATFNNYDGSLLETKLVAVGETPVYEGETPVKPATTSKEYTFTGWNPALVAISNAPVTYTAQFSEKTREYTVQWVNYNGTVLKEEKVAYGTTPTAPVAPTRPNDDYYTYTFDTWSPAVGTVTGNQTYTATYNYEKQVPKYTATFMNGSETVYAPSLKSGEVPVFDGTIPTKTADAQYTYTFDGWSTTDGGALAYALDDALPALTADVTYYAHFATATNNYRIIWKSENGKVTLETDPTVPYGTTPSFDGAKPTKDRMGATVYTFDGWSTAIGGAKIALPQVTGNATYYAHFSDDPVYTVTFNANGHGTAPEAQEVVRGQKVTEPVAPTAEGYLFGGWYKEETCTNAWDFNSDVVNANTTLFAKWTANPYTITFDSNGGSAVESITQGYETSVTAPANPTRTGYTFARWDPEVPSTMPLNGTTCVAQWTPNKNTAYTVNHYKQALDGSYAETPDDTDNLTGTTGESVTPERKSYDGFDAPAGQPVTILADGSRVVTYNYTRKSYNLSWVTDGDALTGSYTHGETKFGATITAPNTPTKTGYTFAGWDADVAATMPAINTTYTATWTANTNTAYAVEHYWQNIADNEYTKHETVNMTGTTATATAAVAKSYEGFDVQSFSQGTIAPDGSTVVKIYYARKTYTITFDSNGGSEVDPITQKYESSVTAPADPSREGYTFDGWSPAVPETMPLNGKTCVAQWTINNNLNIDTLVTVTVSEDATVVTTIVHEGGELEVASDKTLTTDVLILEASASNSGQITGAGNVEVKASTGKAFFDLKLNTPARHWHAFGVPWAVDLTKDPLTEVETGRTLTLGSHYEIVYYDTDTRATQGPNANCWKYLKHYDQVGQPIDEMTPGQGYMIAFTCSVQTVRFVKKAGAPVIYDGAVTVSAEGKGTNQGINALANPMAYHATMNAGPTVGYVHDGGEIGSDGYDEYDINGKSFIVGKAVYIQVQSPESKVTVVVKPSNAEQISKLLAPARRKVVTDKEYLSLGDYYHVSISSTTINGGSVYVLPEEDKEDKYVIGHDLVKMGMSTKKPQIWVNRYGVNLGLNTTAPVNETAEFPVNLYAPTAGEYTITNHQSPMTNDEYIVYLTQNGEAIWNLSDAPYVTSLPAGTNKTYGLRLTARKDPEVATGVDEAVVDAKNEIRKVLIDEKVFIIRGENVYTIDGQMVK